ncbi:MAG: hypothetical protein RR651_03570, partial [Lysinibacillus sp.]
SLLTKLQKSESKTMNYHIRLPLIGERQTLHLLSASVGFFDVTSPLLLENRKSDGISLPADFRFERTLSARVSALHSTNS